MSRHESIDPELRGAFYCVQRCRLNVPGVEDSGWSIAECGIRGLSLLHDHQVVEH